MKTRTETSPATAPPTGRELAAALRRMLRMELPDLDRVLDDLGQIAAAERIVAVFPEPIGPDADLEAAHLRIFGPDPQPLDMWSIGDDTTARWNLTAADGLVQPGQALIIVRQGRAMLLHNRISKQVGLIEPDGTEIHREQYEGSQTGALREF